MKSFLFILMITSTAFYSCQQKQSNQVPRVGSFDSSSIATDTGMEKAIEESYEYSKTLTVSPKLVYDVLAYGGPASEGEYAIIRRGADNKPDTVAKGKRTGIFEDVLLTRLAKDHRNEIIIVNRSTDGSMKGNLIIYALSGEGQLSPIKYNPNDLTKPVLANYAGKDSFIFEGARVIRWFPDYKNSDTSTHIIQGRMRITYVLRDGELKRLDQEIRPK